MTNPNWGLLDNGSGFQNALAQGYQFGSAIKQRREEKELNNALASYDPANPESWRDVAKVDPRTGIQLRGQQMEYEQRNRKAEQEAQEAQLKAQEAGRKQMTQMAQLLNQATPENYQQILGVAGQMGFDVSKVPQAYDPAWVESQKMIVEAFVKDDGQTISGIARELQDAGYQPGTPEFNDAMRGVINNKYASEYVDQGGNTRRRSALNLPPSGQSGPQPGAVVGGFRFKGGDPNDRNSWEQAGGGGGNVTSGFLGGL